MPSLAEIREAARQITVANAQRARQLDERIQIARGWLGEALMKDGSAKDAAIEEALAALADPVCTGSFDPTSGTLQHDGPTCPIHEQT